MQKEKGLLPKPKIGKIYQPTYSPEVSGLGLSIYLAESQVKNY